jgi:hypothetical protein
MPPAYCRRALALSGLIFYSSLASGAGWKSVTLPFGKNLTLELPSEARPMLLGQDWFSNSFAGGAKVPDTAGFASAFQHRFEENPLAIENYSPAVPLENRLRDLTVAKCYAENADVYSYCPPELVKVRSQQSRWGKIFLVSGVMKFRRGGSREVFNEVMMLAVPVGENEAVVLRSLGGEIKKRLLASLGVVVGPEFEAPKSAAVPLAPKSAPLLLAPAAPTAAPTDPKPAPRVPPGNRVD